ncbi:CBS domain-containing protein CBSX5-like isoform X2 [Rutidosis leptorrhynchoides]|uniref:CBS domain-containing protein CBSX5-like isoform X2 n=1 Tax=Rutidosis leptorrhynchoides TaxID=125765 RepID=UPI003A9A0CC2
MAITLLATEISDLCLGKPPLRSLPVTATVADAVFTLKNSEENLVNPLNALQSNVLDLVSNVKGQIRHLEPNSSLLEAIDCILEGAQNLVIPIDTNVRSSPRINQLTKPSHLDPAIHCNQEVCWLTQEDVVRFLLNSIGVFSPIPAFTIEVLDIIDKSTLTVHFDDPAITMLPLISCSLMEQTSIGVVNKDNRLIGEISPFTLASCDETVAAAITTLSAGDLMAYIDFTGPSDDLVNLVKMRLSKRKLTSMLDLMDDYFNPSSLFSGCSSDDEFGPSKNGCVGRFYPGKRSEAIVCHPWNSLMAVMVQMVALRVSYAWVVQQDYTLVGIVTFSEILKQFRSIAGSSNNISSW